MISTTVGNAGNLSSIGVSSFELSLAVEAQLAIKLVWVVFNWLDTRGDLEILGIEKPIEGRYREGFRGSDRDRGMRIEWRDE